jgi:hypothetical protein
LEIEKQNRNKLNTQLNCDEDDEAVMMMKSRKQTIANTRDQGSNNKEIPILEMRALILIKLHELLK